MKYRNCTILDLLAAFALQPQPMLAAQGEEPAAQNWKAEDFFEYIHDDYCTNLLKDVSHTTDREHFLMALDYLETANTLREKEGKGSLQVSSRLMAEAIAYAASDPDPLKPAKLPDHFALNCAWGHTPGAPMHEDENFEVPQNPFDAWYTKEKTLMNTAPDSPYASASFRRLTDENHVLSGFAIDETKGGYGTVFAQLFAKSLRGGETAVPLEDYRNLVAAFEEDLASGEMKGAPSDSLYRLYNAHSGEHFFTVSEKEADYLEKAGWAYEGQAWLTAAADQTHPVYRLYNPNAGDHHYTTSQRERDYLAAHGWKDEGVSFYAGEESEENTVYRLYNPNAKAGAHHFTQDLKEYLALGDAGWKQEGVAWFSF